MQFLQTKTQQPPQPPQTCHAQEQQQQLNMQDQLANYSNYQEGLSAIHPANCGYVNSRTSTPVTIPGGPAWISQCTIIKFSKLEWLRFAGELQPESQLATTAAKAGNLGNQWCCTFQ